MTGRIVTVTAIVALLLIGGVLWTLANSQTQQLGTAAGVRYVFSQSGLQGYSFQSGASEFRYVQRSWFGLGPPTLEVAVENGRLLVDGLDRGAIAGGEQLKVTADHRVLLNDYDVAR